MLKNSDGYFRLYEYC